ncbi:MAG TPA: DUF2934 domain-containing protein [Vicinamibacterales bacterium]|jgi:hypothetical protein
MHTNESEHTTDTIHTTTRMKTRGVSTKLPNAFPGDEQIRQRAYQFFLERHGAPGDPLADWLRAERELIEVVQGPAARKPVRSRTATRKRS